VIEYVCDFTVLYVALYRLRDRGYSHVCLCFSGLCMSVINDEYWMTRTRTLCTMSYGSEMTVFVYERTHLKSVNVVI
jgi:hypothetical protein